MVRGPGGAAFVALSVFGAACMPTGEPPSGRQLRAGRTDELVGILPVRSPGDSPRLLVSRQRPDDLVRVLYVIDVADNGGPPAERPLAENWTNHGCWLGGHCCQADSRGRLLLWEDESVDSPGGSRVVTQNAILVDPDSGERWDLAATDVELSPSRERIAVFRGGPREIELREADDRTTLLTDPENVGRFVGEDYYYIDDTRRLRRVPASATAEVLREQVVNFEPLSTTDGPLLKLRLSGGDLPIALFDPATRQEQLLSPDVSSRFSSLSPDRRWLLLNGGTAVANRSWALLELATGAEEQFETHAEDGGAAEWRPGRAKYWMTLYDRERSDYITAIKKPGTALVTVPGGGAPQYRPGVWAASFFVGDGAYWLSSRSTDAAGRYALHVGPADDPADPGFQLTPDGSMSRGCQPLADGRLLVEASYAKPERGDLIAVDPATGEARVLGQDGSTLDVGSRRVLAILHLANGSGDVAVIDLETGARTVLAAEFGTIAYVQPEAWDPDRAKPGALVAYQFRARFASPYDGLWLTTLP
jgi:hypothetical protein